MSAKDERLGAQGAPERAQERSARAAREPVALERATPEMSPLLGNLLELNIHELSEIFPVELGPDGRYGYPNLPLYWTEPAIRHPFLIKCGARVAGFALATRGSPAGEDPTDLDVAEFFVLRAHRRASVGRRAAFLLWDGLPGRWVVRVSEANRAGLPFWSEAIGSYTGGAFRVESRPGRPAGWRVFRFSGRLQRTSP